MTPNTRHEALLAAWRGRLRARGARRRRWVALLRAFWLLDWGRAA